MGNSWFSEFLEYIAPDGAVYKFDGAVDRFSTNEEGFGMPEIEYITQKGPFQHGETVIDYRLKPRIIQFTHRRKVSGRHEYWSARSNIIDMLRPNRNVGKNRAMGTLRKYLPDGTKRDLSVSILQGPIFATRVEGAYRDHYIEEVIRFYAPSPIFRNPDQRIIYPTNTQSSGMTFPITFPVTLGISIFEAIAPISYVGTWDAYPTIQLYGPMDGPHITNLSTGELIFMDYKIQSGEIMTIALSPSRKLITNNYGQSMKGVVRGSLSSLATFHIASNPEVPSGLNNFKVTGTNYVNGVTHVVISYFDQYIGI